MSSELVEKIVEKILDKYFDKTARKTLKWYVLFQLVKLGLGIVVISVFMLIALLMIQFIF